MIVVEIKKGGQAYRFDLPGWTDLKEAHKLAQGIATGKEFFEDGTQLIDLGTSDQYDHICVVVEAGQEIEIEEPKGSTPALENAKNYIKSFYDKITYLQQPLEVRGIKARADGVAFVLIYEINNQPAQVMLDPDGLKNLTYYQGRVLGYKDPTPIVPPADLLAEEDALEYVEDYLADLIKAAEDLRNDKGKTATAYTSFNKDE